MYFVVVMKSLMMDWSTLVKLGRIFKLWTVFT